MAKQRQPRRRLKVIPKRNPEVSKTKSSNKESTQTTKPMIKSGSGNVKNHTIRANLCKHYNKNKRAIQ